jgi:prophage regulatory protein
LRDKKETKLPTAHLTDVVVSRLKTLGVFYDDITPAFGIRVGKNRKAWIITRGLERQRITIGQYPAMPLAEARKEAKRRLVQPAAESSRLKFSDAYERYKERLATKKPRTQQDYIKSLFGIPYCFAHIARLEAAGKFPKRVQLGACRVAWVVEEVDAWIEERIANRAQTSPS